MLIFFSPATVQTIIIMFSIKNNDCDFGLIFSIFLLYIIKVPPRFVTGFEAKEIF